MKTFNDMSFAELDALIQRASDTKAQKVEQVTGRPVVVTTAHRGVFFGYADDTTGETITLANARLCLYWSSDVKGFMGLAATGPSASCRVGPRATITVRNITSVLEATTAATAAWEGAPWAA